jgi:citrate synthase
MKLADNKATLSFSNGAPSIEMPVYSGSIGPDVIDIRKLYAQSGMFTYDPGFSVYSLLPIWHHLH